MLFSFRMDNKAKATFFSRVRLNPCLQTVSLMESQIGGNNSEISPYISMIRSACSNKAELQKRNE